MKNIHIISGGTRFYVAPHFATSAPAMGATGWKLLELCKKAFSEEEDTSVNLHLTKMAGGDHNLDTNFHVKRLVDELVFDKNTQVVFFPVAMIDHEMIIHGMEQNLSENSGEKHNPRYLERLSSQKEYKVSLVPADKVIGNIRKERKDIFLIGFKETCNFTEDQQYLAGLNLCKKNHVNLVFANDTGNGRCMVITPEEARYYVTTDRNKALEGLVDLVKHRHGLDYPKSEVVEGKHVDWNSELIPNSLRTVVNYCVANNAYKPFNGVTTGHFAVKLSDKEFLTSRRRTNFNDIAKLGLVKIESVNDQLVKAYGSKPSVGGQSQRIIFEQHPDMDCVIHFHAPLRDLDDPDIPQVPQYKVECGSQQCGRQTSEGLKKIGNLMVVYLQEHGPNIVFNRNINPQEVIDFIHQKFDLTKKTGGLVELKGSD